MLELFTGRPRQKAPWLGVDLDGTIAYHTEGSGAAEIGEPIQPMLRRVKKALQAGRTVKIFTARAGDPAQVAKVRAWCIKQGLGPLEVTNVKDPSCEEIWDDRCRGVMANSGAFRSVGESPPSA